jgi:hypothetical protein
MSLPQIKNPLNIHKINNNAKHASGNHGCESTQAS